MSSSQKFAPGLAQPVVVEVSKELPLDQQLKYAVRRLEDGIQLNFEYSLRNAFIFSLNQEKAPIFLKFKQEGQSDGTVSMTVNAMNEDLSCRIEYKPVKLNEMKDFITLAKVVADDAPNITKEKLFRVLIDRTIESLEKDGRGMMLAPCEKDGHIEEAHVESVERTQILEILKQINR